MTHKKYTFSKNERLKSRKEISRIFTNGIFLYSKSFSLGYLTEKHQKSHQIAVTVPKKLFKSAVIRNKLKRRIKESYRLNKEILYNFSQKTHTFYKFLIIYKTTKVLNYQEINKEVTQLLNKLTNY